ncbi:MAG: DNA mismatch repair endonuclease MutL [Bacilli bacterium]|jgi:DNA mismatch repair protein MutL|nr:DNA mismatch repair endonuclease MutL [Bacilli bacterium]
MGNILKLNQELTNLIAAGEVIERVSSVVKELVENSIDAKAKSIEVRLIDSGLTEITVIDDGTGMDAVDAKMALEPHATSKIKTSEDLFKIGTLGFRGEALPSIIAVSYFKLKTSTNGKKGIMLSLKGGAFLSEAMVACPKGCEITVKNLFFNTPARLQSLQHPNIELSYITDYMNKVALANPDLSFLLTNNDKEILRTYGRGENLETILSIYGTDLAKDMLDIFDNDGYYQISGYISKPSQSRSTKNHITIIVNGRTIRNYHLIQAVLKGYEERLVSGRYPIAVIQLKMDLGLVDVNVHPAKLEVRFSNEDNLADLITRTIRTRLAKANLTVDMKTVREEKSNPFLELYDEFDKVMEENQTDIIEEEPISYQQEAQPHLPEKEMYQQEEYSFLDPDEDQLPGFKLPKMNYIGQLFGTYILAQAEKEFYLVDQHAAAERINYEKIMDELAKEDNLNYELLVPLQLNFSAAEMFVINEYQNTFQSLGLQLEEFGKNTLMVRSVPVWIVRGMEKEFVEEIIAQVILNKKTTKQEFLNNLAKELACKKSIKGNEFHSKMEFDFLLDDLSRARNPYSCPHGRPVIVKFTQSEIERWFNRLV